MRLYTPLPTAVFWVLVITAISIIVFQIVRIPWPGYEPILITEIIVLAATLHLVYLIPFYRFTGHDVVQYMNLAEQISKYGMVMADRPGAESIVAWPFMFIWGAELNYITGIDLFEIVKWLPSLFMSSAFILLIYIFIKRVFIRQQVAFLAILLMATILYFTYEGGDFKTEFFALTLMIAGLYLITRTHGVKNIEFTCLSILCLAGVILSHNATSFIVLLFFIVYYIVDRILNSRVRNLLPSLTHRTLVITLPFLLLAVVGVMAYWIYINDSFLQMLAAMGRTIIYGQAGPIVTEVSPPIAGVSPPIAEVSPPIAETSNAFIETGATFAEVAYVVNPLDIITVRGMITFWGYYIFHAAFAVILSLGLLARNKEKNPEFYSFTLFLFLIGAWVLIQLYFIPFGTQGIMSAERWLMLGWLWGFPPLAFCIWKNKQKWGKRFGLILLISFIIFNIYMIPPTHWDFQSPGKEEGLVVLKEDYSLAATIPFGGKGASYKMSRVPIQDVQGYYPTDFRRVMPDEVEGLDWVVLKQKELEDYAKTGIGLKNIGRIPKYDLNLVNKLLKLLTDDSSSSRHRIYDSGTVTVLK
jgi:hypothetical protein